MKMVSHWCVAVLTALMLAGHAFGATDILWQAIGGDSNGNWNDPAHWVGGNVPDLSDLSLNPLLGDMNGDVTVNNQDIAAFVLALTDPVAFALAYPNVNPLTAGDINGDHLLNNQDIAAFVALLTNTLVSENALISVHGEAAYTVTLSDSMYPAGLAVNKITVSGRHAQLNVSGVAVNTTNAGYGLYVTGNSSAASAKVNFTGGSLSTSGINLDSGTNTYPATLILANSQLSAGAMMLSGASRFTFSGSGISSITGTSYVIGGSTLQINAGQLQCGSIYISGANTNRANVLIQGGQVSAVHFSMDRTGGCSYGATAEVSAGSLTVTGAGNFGYKTPSLPDEKYLLRVSGGSVLFSGASGTNGVVSLGVQDNAAAALEVTAGSFECRDLKVGSLLGKGYYNHAAGSVTVRGSLMLFADDDGGTATDNGSRQFILGPQAILNLTGAGFALNGVNAWLLTSGNLDLSGTVRFDPAAGVNTQHLPAFSRELGADPASAVGNYAIGTLDLTALIAKGKVLSIAPAGNFAANAVYVRALIGIPSGANPAAFLTGSNLNVYYNPLYSPNLCGSYAFGDNCQLIPLAVSQAGSREQMAVALNRTPTYLYNWNTNKSVGWKFTANKNMTVTQVGIYDADRDGLDPNYQHKVAFFNAAGQMIGNPVTVQTGPGAQLANEYRMADVVGGAVQLTAGQDYWIVAVTNGGSGCTETCTDKWFQTSSSSEFSLSPAVTFLGGHTRDGTDSTPLMPTYAYTSNNYLAATFSYQVTNPDLSALPVTSGLTLWLDAADANAFKLVSDAAASNQVVIWKDKSAKTLAMIPQVNTSASRPTRIDNALNNLAVVRVSAANAGLCNSSAMSSLLGSGQYTFLAVVQANTSSPAADSASSPTIVGGSDRSATLTYRRIDGQDRWTAVNYDGSRDEATVPQNVGYPVLLSGTLAGGTLTLYRDGVAGNSAATGNLAPEALARALGLAANQTGTDLFDGRIAEILVFNRALSTSERQQAEAYLRNKWLPLPLATMTSLGKPVRGARVNANFLSPKSGGAANGYYYLVQYATDWVAGAAPTWVRMNLNTQNPAAVVLNPAVNVTVGGEIARAKNGHTFLLQQSAGLRLQYYDANAEQIVDLGEQFGWSENATDYSKYYLLYWEIIGKDERYYVATISKNGTVAIVRLDPRDPTNPASVKKISKINPTPVRTTKLTYPKYLTADYPWCYVAVGQGQWTLMAVDVENAPEGLPNYNGTGEHNPAQVKSLYNLAEAQAGSISIGEATYYYTEGGTFNFYGLRASVTFKVNRSEYDNLTDYYQSGGTRYKDHCSWGAPDANNQSTKYEYYWCVQGNLYPANFSLTQSILQTLPAATRAHFKPDPNLVSFVTSTGYVYGANPLAFDGSTPGRTAMPMTSPPTMNTSGMYRAIPNAQTGAYQYTIGWTDSQGYHSANFDAPVRPVPIYWLSALSDNTLVGHATDYQGLFRYWPDTAVTEFYGQNTISRCRMAQAPNGKVYMTGYPHCALYEWNPSAAYNALYADWSVIGSGKNPQRLGTYYTNASNLCHYPYDIIAATVSGSDHRIYVTGRAEREGDYGGVGYYRYDGAAPSWDGRNGQVGHAKYDSALATFNGRGLVYLPASGRLVVSGRSTTSAPAPLLVYNADLTTRLDSIEMKPNLTYTGDIRPGIGASDIVGSMHEQTTGGYYVLYRYDVLAKQFLPNASDGWKTFASPVYSLAANPSQAGYYYALNQDRIIKIDIATMTVTPLCQVPTQWLPSRLVWCNNVLYGVVNDELFRINLPQ